MNNVSVPKSPSRGVSFLGAWALSFGCAVGWGAFVMPGVAFLPKAGPLGTVIGVFVGAVIMMLVAWNYHAMTNRFPGSGGAYSFVKEAFGPDHSFLCAWFLVLSYVAIVWANATALAIVAHYALGDVFRVGWHYSVAGFEVWTGEIVLAGAAICIAGVLNCRRRVAGFVQTLLAVAFAVGIAVCIQAALFKHDGGLVKAAPAFAPDGSSPLAQILRIVAISPWLYVGFESIAHASGEFSFNVRRSFDVMIVALVCSAFAYAALAVLPTLVPIEGTAGWVDYVGKLGEKTDDLELPTFASAKRALGGVGVAVISATMVGAIFTGLVGNIFAASRLMATMADDGILPKWCARRSSDGSPAAAALAIAGGSLVIPLLGRTAIGFIVDVSTIGAAITYAYVSACSWHFAGANRLEKACGAGGMALSVVIIALFIVPNYASGAMMATESYLILVLWCVAGFLFYRHVFRNDSSGRFGKSTVVWMAMVLIVTFMSLLWMRQTTGDTARRVFADIERMHEEIFPVDVSEDSSGWQMKLDREERIIGMAFMRGSIVQTVLMLVAFAILLNLYSLLRSRDREREREKTRARSYFFSTVSHDIRTPLNAIIGFSEILRDGFKSERERTQALDVIISSGKTLLGLVNDILDLSKLESGRMEIVPQPTDCSAVLDGVVDSFRVTGSKPDVELSRNVAPMPPLMLDPQRLRQISFNLFGNAVKFTDRGHVVLRASFSPDAADGSRGTFRLAIEDTGCGIAPDDLKQITSPYVQVGSKISRNGGTGLGLAICKQLAEAAGGTLDVESSLGLGSTFTVTLPGVTVAETATPAPAGADSSSDSAAVAAPASAPDFAPETAPDSAPASSPPAAAQADVAPVPDSKSAASPSAPTPAVAESAPPAASAPAAASAPETQSEIPKRILLVDDAKVNLLVQKAQLKKLGNFDIMTAEDGEQALKVLQTPGAAPFDLVLTDMWMPNMDGEGLVREIRSRQEFSGLRVVVVTADVELKGKAGKMGFDGILLKPVPASALAATIRGEAPEAQE